MGCRAVHSMAWHERAQQVKVAAFICCTLSTAVIAPASGSFGGDRQHTAQQSRTTKGDKQTVACMAQAVEIMQE